MQFHSPSLLQAVPAAMAAPVPVTGVAGAGWATSAMVLPVLTGLATEMVEVEATGAAATGEGFSIKTPPGVWVGLATDVVVVELAGAAAADDEAAGVESSLVNTLPEKRASVPVSDPMVLESQLVGPLDQPTRRLATSVA